MPKRSWYNYIVGDIYVTDDDPRKYSERRKNIIILLVALSGVAGPMSSMMYMPGLLAVTQDLNTTISAVNGTISAYVVFMGISPLFWAALSDTWGRKRMYLLSGLITVISSVISALSSHIGMLVVFRALQSFGANAGLTLGAGVIADTIPVEERGKAYGIFYSGPLLGPVIGPTIGGFLCQYLGWRSTFYFTAILCGILLVFTAFFLPETLRKQKPSTTVTDTKCHDKKINELVLNNNNNNNTHNNKDEDDASVYAADTPTQVINESPLSQPQQQHASSSSSFLNALQDSFGPMWIMLYDPNQILLMLFTSIIFASLYIMNPTITQTFKNIYGYTEWQTGLCYLSLGAGFMIGSIVSGRHSDYLLLKLSKKASKQQEPYGDQPKICPEMRLQAAVPSFFLMPAGYLIYGWCTEKKVGVYAPLIGLFIYSMGQMWAFTPVSVYLVDTKPGYSATAVGINSCIRCIFAAVTTVFSSQAVDALGTGIIFTILAAIGVLNGGFVLACYIWGTKWRRAFEKKHMPALYMLNSTDLDLKEDPSLSNHNLASAALDLQQLERVHTHHSASII
ncbi:major facilitator superfamily domain-containing protein [Mycotypha africana]|uniref:major facilitator superfamily domain-containing protein n=1 Tax=Mycotypha africana TaxID=64632 RepID=UPI00230137DF|nr:major facilitator superfamily domain-containing protein [Mycotypha africana]KAI8967135.1 major facilitator superfamily domain-containing protein [Mycotypha africana]